MCRRWIGVLLFLFASAPVLAWQLASRRPVVAIDESSIHLTFEQERSAVFLLIENRLGSALPLRIELQLLDPRDKAISSAEFAGTVSAGANQIEIPFPLATAKLKANERREFLWYRLRYRLSAVPPSKTAQVLEGMVSLSRIAPDIFELTASLPRYAAAGKRLTSHLRAVFPATSLPARGVQVNGSIHFDVAGQPVALKASGTTNAGGDLILEFDLPSKIDSDEVDYNVTGELHGFSQTVSASSRLLKLPEIQVMTDKTIYQPGQMLHARALVLDRSHHAAAALPVVFALADPDGLIVYRASKTTSRFGICSIDWQIPSTTRLGDFRLQVAPEGEESEESASAAFVKVTRYELPAFSVLAQPDRPYYLPGQNAEIDISATYLFGKPIARGRVRVVREEERHWSFEEQKWETKESESFDGSTDDSGHFMLRLDLTAKHDTFAHESYSRYQDLDYAVYCTDRTTRRTEQRRFSIRLTRQPIHIYVSHKDNEERLGMPLRFWLSTYYADGTPAKCHVTIESAQKNNSQKTDLLIQPKSQRIHLETNNYGLAKVTNLNTIASPTDARSNWVSMTLLISATDGEGRHGEFSDSVWLSSGPVIRLDTNKVLYRPGEPIEVTVTTSGTSAPLVVLALCSEQAISSQVIERNDGSASLRIPYDPAFVNEVTLAAYPMPSEESCDYACLTGERTVMYPKDTGLKVNIQFTKSAYLPGEEAEARLSVRNNDGRPMESALGVVVFDKAVEERTRMDQEFGGGYDPVYLPSLFRSKTEIAGFTREDFTRIDMNKPVPENLEMVADALLNSAAYYGYEPQIDSGDTYVSDLDTLFDHANTSLLQPIREALAEHYLLKGVYPEDEASLKRLLLSSSVFLNDIRDPWGRPIRPAFSIVREKVVLTLFSAGPDKIFDTCDDVRAMSMAWPYFRNIGESIDRSVAHYHARTSRFIRDRDTLRSELLRHGIELDGIKDPWGRPYFISFDVHGSQYLINVRCAGPNGLIEEPSREGYDDFVVWTSSINYFKEYEVLLGQTLNKKLQTGEAFPGDIAALAGVLRSAGIEPDTLRDPWGHLYYPVVWSEYRYADRATIESRSSYGRPPQRRLLIQPVTERLDVIALRSCGKDGKRGTLDDFEVARFTNLGGAVPSDDSSRKIAEPRASAIGWTGAISGIVQDPMSAVIPAATITATHGGSSLHFGTQTDASGKYLLKNLPPGAYTIRIEKDGFIPLEISNVLVYSVQITTLNATLDVGVAAETVTVRASEDAVLEKSTVVAARGKDLVRPVPLSTPRLRNYFPETLLWQPEIVTNQAGEALLKFKLADNITTWKMAVVGSTADGQTGDATQEFRAFKPFFIDHDPPQVLTQGDWVSLPVVLRNYMQSEQRFDVEVNPESWFETSGPSRFEASVASGESLPAVFRFRAVEATNNGIQRVTARGPVESDAVEKPVIVHPNGQEVSDTKSQLFGEYGSFDFNIPNFAIKESLVATLKVYPNLMTHVVESIEGILERPHGCGEQTISSTYPSLLVLKAARAGHPVSASIRKKAEKYLQQGYDRLLGYQDSSGGFTYWGRGEPDVALTAYALEFLSEAGAFIHGRKSLEDDALRWLLQRQALDGRWIAKSWVEREDHRRTIILTAYVARVLSALPKQETSSGPAETNEELARATAIALKHVGDYLAMMVAEADEPYALASYLLYAKQAGQADKSREAASRLLQLAHTEAETAYWSIETNTPFYGWGLAGRIETTALAVRALASQRTVPAAARSKVSADSPSIDALIDRGLLFLIRNKDRDGVWHSSQATVNVLHTLVSLLSARDARPSSLQDSVKIFVNGSDIRTLILPPEGEPASLLSADLSQWMHPGANHVEIKRADGVATASAQLVVSMYIPWSHSRSSSLARTSAGTLHLSVSFDRSSLSVSDPVTATVRAERAGFHGYGMLLGEIGLPPGAEVDRASLDEAMRSSGGSFAQYDVLPDRLVVYLWPQAGGVRFRFTFRLRFGLNALSAASLLYDYYNPDLQAIVPPVRFIVSDEKADTSRKPARRPE